MSEPQSQWQQDQQTAIKESLQEATASLRQASDRTKEVEARIRQHGQAHSTLPYLHPEQDPAEIAHRAAIKQAMVEEERRQFRDKAVLAALGTVIEQLDEPYPANVATAAYNIADALLAERDRRAAQQT